MAFPNRIKAIGSMIPNGSMIVDVGADHGLLEKYVLLKKKNCYIQAVENKLGPFRILLDNLSGFKNIEIQKLGPIISASCGPATLGVYYKGQEELRVGE